MNAQTRAGCTPLLLAAQQGHEDVVRALLDGGGDPRIIEPEYGMGPADVCGQSVLELLRERGCAGACALRLLLPPRASR